MEQFITEVIKFAPAVAILIWLAYQQQKQIKWLVSEIVNCYQRCDEDDESH